MIIQIELIIIFIIAIILLVWAVWFRWSRRRARKKYNPDNEKYKTRKGGEDRGSSEVGGRDYDIEDTDSSVPRPIQSTERTILPSTITGRDRQTQHQPGKNGRRLGNALIRRIKTNK